MSTTFGTLLQRADDLAHADRAWHRMKSWEPAPVPSVFSEQIDAALELTRDGADPVQLCKFDEVELRRAERDREETVSFEAFKKRFGWKP